ncbi:CocE/NonD family hydrolase [Williamsia sp. 1135]|uniref:CocE/NonD family hydrolase n=2 Tax=Williamsia TaxID=85043 RepID=UPI0026A16542
MSSGNEYTQAEEFFSSHGVRCAATVYRPSAPVGPVPVVVMAHGFAATRGIRLPAYAERFATAGYAVVLFDYR